MTRGKMYPRCTQCDKLFSENGYWDDSISLSRIEAFPYCSDCIEKNGWKKCSSCDNWGNFNNKCSDCHLKESREEILEKSKKDLEEKKRIAVEEMAKLHQKRINEVFTCKGTCGRVIPLDEECYTWPRGSSDFYCKKCIEIKVVQEYDKKHQNDPNDKLTCGLCKVKTANYRWPDTGAVCCETCKPRFVIGIAAMEKIIKGEVVNISSLNLPDSDKISLWAGQKILKGENVDIGNLAIDEEDKQELRQLQQQNPPKNGLSFDYLNKCKDCGKEEKSVLVGFICQHCNSRNIETWKDGKLHGSSNKQQTNDPNKKKSDNDTPPWVIPAGLILSASSFFLYRWWKKRKNKYSLVKN